MVSSLLLNVINHALGARISLLKQFKLDSLRLPHFAGQSKKKVINVYAMEIKSILKHKNKYADKKVALKFVASVFCLLTYVSGTCGHCNMHTQTHFGSDSSNSSSSSTFTH